MYHSLTSVAIGAVAVNCCACSTQYAVRNTQYPYPVPDCIALHCTANAPATPRIKIYIPVCLFTPRHASFSQPRTSPYLHVGTRVTPTHFSPPISRSKFLAIVARFSHSWPSHAQTKPFDPLLPSSGNNTQLKHSYTTAIYLLTREFHEKTISRWNLFTRKKISIPSIAK